MQRAWFVLWLSLALLAPASGFADIVNGDFEQGGTAWTVQVPANWVGDFPPAGGNPDGYARIRSPFGNSGGEGCIVQSFQCGDPGPGTCAISLQYRLDIIDANALSGRVKIYLDNVSARCETPTPVEPSTWGRIKNVYD